jgi:hypothetical protein
MLASVGFRRRELSQTATTLTNAAKQPSDLPGNSSLFRDRHQTTDK